MFVILLWTSPNVRTGEGPPKLLCYCFLHPQAKRLNFKLVSALG